MSDRTKGTAEAQSILFVPLNKLKKSDKNVRKVPHTKAEIKALAASIATLIAARFGVTTAAVKQRLKLGAVRPKLIALYRKGGIALDQLSAFAITEDHGKQERVWHELSRHNRSREAILRALSEGQVRTRFALIVGTARRLDGVRALGHTVRQQRQTIRIRKPAHECPKVTGIVRKLLAPGNMARGGLPASSLARWRST
jgi:HAMP domain-containing protein